MDAQVTLGSEVPLLPSPEAGSITRMRGDPGDLPARIGRYRVLDEIGAGGMGVVYAAYDPLLDRKVALKLMYGEADDRRARRSEAMLRREAQALARLSHPNIVGIYDVGVHAGQVFVTMEFVAGRTLRQWCEETPRGWQAIVAAFVQAGRGLTAAHAVGLVHRDVKPDNLLIGDDGRVRVADFGVARFTDPDDTPASVSSERPLATVAGRGALVGTPAYMAPEQHDNDGVGPHSDQFGFCVALYEALFGLRPFAGSASASLRDAIRGGPPRRPPGPSRVPPWLERAVVRGLSARPEDRWPTMQALLDALVADPALRRERLRRRALIVGLALACAVALVLAGRELVAWRAHELRERAASERLAGATGEIDRLLARGHRAAAEEALRAFVGEPEHHETRAALDAWLLWADRMEAAGDGEASQAALIEAYMALPPDDPREPALFLRIGRRFHARWQFPELSALATRAASRWPDAVATAAWADLRADAALARRDPAAYLAEVEGGLAGAAREGAAPVVRALDEQRFIGLRGARALPVDVEGDGALELAVFATGGAGPKLLGRSLAPVAGLGSGHTFDGGPIGQGLLTTGPGGPSYFVDWRRGERPEARLYELGPGGLRTVYTWPDDRPQAAAAADLDGDGVRELYVGTGSYTRKLHRLTRDASGVWRHEPAHPASDRLSSDVNALAAGDFDGDGREELAVALGPWLAYDVRILQMGADGRIEVGARWRLGHVRALSTVRGVDGATLLAIAHDAGAPSKFAFTPDRPHGEPPGLYVVRRAGERLVPVFHAPLPTPEYAPHPGHPRWLGRGDFDGDGRDDLVLSYEPPEARRDFATALLWRQLEGGDFALAPLGGFYPLYAGNLDDDPADELLVKLVGPDDQELAVLGAGGGPVPRLPDPPASAVAPPLTDPVLARAWARAEDLADFGLHAAAARALERRAPLARTRDEARLLRRRAAALFTSAGEHPRAAASLEALADAGDPDAGLEALAAYEQARRFADARRVADALLSRDDLTADQRAAARAAGERAAAIVDRRDGFELRFDGSLDPRWRVVEPLGIRLDRVDRHLDVDAFADLGDLMTLPLEVVGGPLTVEIELDVDRSEWGGSLGVAIRRETGEKVAWIGVGGVGGGGELHRYDSFEAPEIGGRHDFSMRMRITPDLSTHHVLRLRVLPEQRVIDIAEDGDNPSESAFPLAQELRPGRHVLALRAADVPSHGAQLLRARVHRITVEGARPVALDQADDPRARAARALVAEDAPQLVADAPPLWRAAAALERGDFDAARAAVAAVDPAEPAARARLRHLLRARPELAAPLLRAAYGPTHAELLREAFATAVRMHLDEPLQRQWLAATADLDALPVDTPERRTTTAELLRMRALVWRSLAELDRAAAELGRCAELLAAGDRHDDRLAEIELLRAELDVERRRPDAALDAVERALARATDPGWMAERVQLSAWLVPLHADPRWSRALAAAR